MKFPTHSWSAADPRSATPSKTVRPGDDFHRHVLEGWLRTANIPQGLPATDALTEFYLSTDQRTKLDWMDAPTR